MKITETKLRSTIKNLILEYDLIKLTEKAKPYLYPDPDLHYWLRNNRWEGFDMESFAMNPAATPSHAMKLIDTSSALSGHKIVGKISNYVPAFNTYLFVEPSSYGYVVLHVNVNTNKGEIAKGFGDDYSKLAEIVNHIKERVKPPPNPEIDKYISTF